MELSIILSFFNKEEEVLRNIPLICKYLEGLNLFFEVICINDGSQDGTLECIQKMESVYSCLRSLSWEVNQGRGYSVKEGMLIARGKKVIYMDTDFPQASSIEYLGRLTDQLSTFPVVVGNRFNHGKMVKRKWYRKIMGKTYFTLIHLVFPELEILDVEMGLKGFVLEKVLPLLKKCDERRWSFDLELMFLCYKAGLKCQNLDVEWKEDYQSYSSSVNILRDSVSQLLGLFRVRRRHG